MQTLKLNDDNFERIFKKEKTQSIRLGLKKFTTGRAVIENVDTGETVNAIIKGVDLATVRHLTHAHAVADGFSNTDELVSELVRIYEGIHPDDTVTLVSFDVV